jgi:hypothetical protein
MPAWVSNSVAPEWAQAIFAFLAILFAIGITAWQRSRALRDSKDERIRRDKEHLRRLIAGLKAEIDQTIRAAKNRQESVEQILKNVAAAREQGIRTTLDAPVAPHSMVVTDAIMYRQVAAELGRLPPEIIDPVVSFYAFALEMGRVADRAPSAVEANRMFLAQLPKLRLYAAMLVKTLGKFEASGFAAGAECSTLTGEEVRLLAEQVGYPLDAVLKESGVKL